MEVYVALFKEECADDIHTYPIAVSETLVDPSGTRWLSILFPATRTLMNAVCGARAGCNSLNLSIL